MSLALTIFLFLVGLVLIIKGGDWFVDAAAWMAEASGMPKFLIGATIVSVATTLPEIIVSTMATHQFLEQLLMAEEDRFRPMAMMIGPVTIGGKKRMTLLAPKALNRAARMTYIRPAHSTQKQA